MTMKSDTKIEEELTCHFKTDMGNLTNLYWSTQKPKKIALQLAPLTKVNVWAKKSTGELCVMALKIDAKFKEKVTCAFKKWHEEFGKYG